MRIGILIVFLIAGLAGSPPASAAEDTGTTQGPHRAGDAAKQPAPPPSVTVIGARDAHGILGREVRSAATKIWGASST